MLYCFWGACSTDTVLCVVFIITDILGQELLNVDKAEALTFMPRPICVLNMRASLVLTQQGGNKTEAEMGQDSYKLTGLFPQSLHNSKVRGL